MTTNATIVARVAPKYISSDPISFGDTIVCRKTNGDIVAIAFEKRGTQVKMGDTASILMSLVSSATTSAATALGSIATVEAARDTTLAAKSLFDTDYAAFGLDYAAFNIDYAAYGVSRTAFDGDYAQFNIDLAAFNLDLGGFDADYAQFNIDLAAFGVDYSQFNADLGVFNTNYSTFTSNYSTFGTDYSAFLASKSDFDTKYADTVTKHGDVVTKHGQVVADAGVVAADRIVVAADKAQTLVYRNETEVLRDDALANAGAITSVDGRAGVVTLGDLYAAIGDVLTPVPAGAVFTDTAYDDTALSAAVALNTAKVSNVDHPLVETAVPLGALFTDTVYTHPTTHTIAEVDGLQAALDATASTAADVGLGNVDNTSDASKPISTATQTALNGKAATSHTHAATDLTEFVTPTGDYGTVQVTSGSWAGYSIGGTSCYMAEPSGGSGLYNDADNAWLLYAVNGGATKLYYAGSLRIETTAGGVSVTGTITATSNITAYSDERLKTDWQDIDVDFLGQLSQVKSGTYTRIDSGERQVGVSAQDIQKIIPEAVIEDDEGTLSLAYGNAALVACVELAKEVKQLRAEIEELKDGITS